MKRISCAVVNRRKRLTLGSREKNMQLDDSTELPKREKRDKWVNIKVTEKERNEWQAFAQLKDKNLSDVLRQLIADEMGVEIRLENLPVKKKQVRASRKINPELLRELAKIGNNLNQIARWANTYKSDADALEVVQALLSIQRAMPDAR
jgi:hypothetical protein